MSGPHPILADYLTLFQSSGRGEGRLNWSSPKILTFRWPCNQSTAAQTRGRGEGSHFPFWWHASSSSSSSWKASWRQFRFTLEAKKIAAWLAIQFLAWESFLLSAARPPCFFFFFLLAEQSGFWKDEVCYRDWVETVFVVLNPKTQRTANLMMTFSW